MNNLVEIRYSYINICQISHHIYSVSPLYTPMRSVKKQRVKNDGIFLEGGGDVIEITTTHV
jgi:hypothetical protein